MDVSRKQGCIAPTAALAVLEHAPIALVATSPVGLIVYANQRAQTLFGRGLEQLIEHALDELLVAEARPERAARWQAYEAAIEARPGTAPGTWPGAGDAIRLRGVHSDGSEIALQLSLSHTDVDGAPVVIAAIQPDASAAASEVEALGERVAYLSELIDLAPMGLYESKATDDYGATFISNGIRSMLGYAPDEFIRDPGFWLEHIHPDDRQHVLDTLETLDLAVGRLDYEYRFQTRNGEYIWMRDMARLVYDAEGKPQRFVGCWSDTTARNVAAAALAAEEERHRALLSAIPDMIFRLDGNGTYLDIKAHGELLVPPDLLIGTNVRDNPVPSELNERILAAMGRVVETGVNETMEYELEVEGVVGYFEARFSKAGPNEVVAIIRDITERTRSEQRIRELNLRLAQRNIELETTNQELESFSYSVSHDLRGPLRAIDGFSLVLHEDYGDKLDARARNMLARVRAASQRMGQVIDDLLCLSRITRTTLSPERIDLSALVAEAAENLRVSYPDHPVQLVIAPHVLAFGDRNLVRVLLDNVLGNAWKYTTRQSHARVEFGAMKQADQMVYFVRDNGVGFDAQYADKLFGAFQRLHSGQEFPGSGIGLATAARVVQRHGGQIWAEGALGQGATFYFTLAAEEAD